MSSVKMYKIPDGVKKQADIALKLRENGFKGGTQTGWSRARQLKNCQFISADVIKIMKAWFARHGPDANNGGTSYPGYKKWLRDEKPMKGSKSDKNKYRGAVSWLLWGGDEGFRWVSNIDISGHSK